MSTLPIPLLEALLFASLAGSAMMLASLVIIRRRVRWSGCIRHHLLMYSVVTTTGIFLAAVIAPSSLGNHFAAPRALAGPGAASSDRMMEFYTVTAAGKFADLAPPVPAESNAPRGPSRWILAAVFAWLAGVLLWMAGIARGRLRVRRIVREASPVDDPALAARVAALAGRMGIRRPIRLLRHPAVAVPAVTGTARPALLLPAGFERLAPATADMVFLHELAHIRRLDGWSSLFGELAAALFWFNPVARLTTRRMRELQEMAADSNVVSQGVRPSDYARFLLETQRTLTACAGLASAAAHSIAGRSPMDTRLRAILDRRSSHRMPSRLLTFAAAIPFLIGGLTLLWIPDNLGAAGAPDRQTFVYGRIDRALLNQTSIDELVRPVCINKMADRYIAGAAIAVVHEGKVIYEGGFGRREVFEEVPVDSRKTIWRIGSITKVMTGVAVMQLVDRGLIDLDRDVNDYLTGFRVASFPGKPIRVRHLLTHTAGFDQIGLGRHAESMAAIRPLRDFLEEYLHPIRPPGEVSSYDTYGITLAGYLVERVSGLPYEEYLRRNIFQPLAMNRSGIVVPETLRGDVAVGYGFAGSWEAQPWEYMNTAPASSVNATVDDMAHFMIMMLEGGKFEGRQVLQAPSVRAMLTQQFTNDPDQPGYGFTFFEDRSFGLPAFSHGGSMEGFGSFLYLVPKERLGVFIAVNQESGVLQTAVLSALLSGLFPDRPQAPAMLPRLSEPVDLSRFTGTYASNMYNHSDPEAGWRIRPIELKPGPEGGLVFDGQPAFPVGALSFQRDDGLLLTFKEDDQGAIIYMFVNQTVYERIR